MTRETKIGLLVGLAFIIVIGILLSDHLTSSTEPPQAALAGAGNNVRSAVTVPGQPAPQAPATTPQNATPNQPVPTQNELTPGPNPVSIVKIGPAAGAQPQQNSPVVTSNPPPAQGAVAGSSTEQPSAPESKPSDQPQITRINNTQTPKTSTPMENVARQHGEELVLLDSTGHAIHTNAKAPRGAMAEYKAEAGDSLSKMASRLMGANTATNRAAIVAANPSLKSDPNKVIVGHTYLIPTSAESTAAVLNNAAPAPVVSTPPIESPVQPADAQATVSKQDGGEFTYTVKEGDTLWKIAREQLGRGGAWAALKELNKDVLVGDKHEDVVVGMKLRLPSKIAQAN